MTIELEHHGKAMDIRDIHCRDEKDIAERLMRSNEPVFVALEPGDGTRYEIILHYHPAYGIIYTVVSANPLSIVIDLDESRTIWNIFDTLPIKNAWTKQIHNWYSLNLCQAILEMM